MAGKKSDFVLPTLDDLFSTQEMRDEAKLARIRDIPIELIVKKCTLCDYTSYRYVAAKSVIADYYGVVDGQPHTLSVTDLSESGVTTQIRYGLSADGCTLASAPNYTEQGQYAVYYEIIYAYQDSEMKENGVAYVWLRDEASSEVGSDKGCSCGCRDPQCGFSMFSLI